MDRQQIGLKLALDALGWELSLDEFNDRLALQKVIYLAQAAGIHLGYTYGWYLRGPYSRDLTRDAFNVRAELQQATDDSAGWKFDPASASRLARLRTTLFDPLSSERPPRRLELLASLHFLLTTRQGRADNPAGLRKTLCDNDKHFTEMEISQAIEELKRHDLFPAPR